MSKSGGVSKHCSILNYIKHENSELYELVQDLCIGRIFNPRRGTPGITFLHPDKSLLSQIKKMADGDNPEEAVAAIQSLVLLDYLPANSDFDDKKSDIPTFLRKKLPVASVSGAKVTLSNGAELTVDKKFKVRGDRSNMAVYNLTKKLVPTDTEPATFVNAKKGKNSKVKGGADFQRTKVALFEDVVTKQCEGKNRDYAMETLVSLVQYLKMTNSAKHLDVCSQLSWDTLATLAIVLQPYRNVEDECTYITASDFAEFSTLYSRGGELSSVYAYVINPHTTYKEMMESAVDSKAQNAVKAIAEEVFDKTAKANVPVELAAGYKKASSRNVFPVNSVRAKVLQNNKLAMAESELRVMSAVLLDNCTDVLDKNEFMDLFKFRCNLNAPYVVNSREQIQTSNIGFFYSVALLISRSSGFIHLPCMPGSALSEIHDLNVFISLDCKFENIALNYYQDVGSDSVMVKMLKEALASIEEKHKQPQSQPAPEAS